MAAVTLALMAAEASAAGTVEPAWLRILLLRDYNTRVVMLGTLFLGFAAGLIGTFMLLRGRALLSDAVSHSALPGIAVAFMIMVRMGGDGKFTPGLLAGAVTSGLIGTLFVLLIRKTTHIKEDAALGITLSVFFGLGIALLGVIQKMDHGNAAGLESFIYGKTASMLAADAWLIGGAALVIAVTCLLLFKEFTVLCFDPSFAESQGWPVTMLDLVLMVLVIAVTVIGLQAVGLILIIALLVIPSAAARFWTERLRLMMVIAPIIGGLSAFLGAGLSALLPRVPAGAVIVLVGTAAFGVSMLFGTARGVLVRLNRHLALTRRIGRQHLLRAVYEMVEEGEAAGAPVRRDALLARRSWSVGELARLIRGARRNRELAVTGETVALTEAGADEAARLVRNHRLWELYLITHADIATSHVDRDADQIEHVLGADLVRQLEELLERRPGMPACPHAG